MNELPGGLYPLLSDNLLAPAEYPEAARALVAAGVGVLQLRMKVAHDRDRLAVQRAVMSAIAGYRGVLVIDDRADLARIAADEAAPGLRVGLHLGQEDLPAQVAREIVGPAVLLGLSTHNEAQLLAARALPVDYLGFGPVFATATKENPDPTVGLAGLRAACRIAHLPVVAIGGIALDSISQVREAGARAVAIVGALFHGPADGLTARAAAAHRAACA